MKETKICKNCKKIIEREPKHKLCWQLIKFCSGKCSWNYHYCNYRKEGRRKKGFINKVECSWCDKIFIMKTPINKFCSSECREIYNSYKKTFKRNKFKISNLSKEDILKRLKKNCGWCGNNFNAIKLSDRYCSSECRNKGVEFFRKNKESRRKKSLAQKHKLSIEEYIELSRECEICGFKEVVAIHHLIPKSKGGKDIISNYVSLCPNHHVIIHKRDMNVNKLKELHYGGNKNEINKCSI